MTSLLAYIAETEPFFMDQRYPEKTMTYFTQMGTISLTILRDQVTNYKDIYNQSDLDEQRHITDLKNKIDVYLNCSNRMYSKAVEWRSSLTKFEIEKFGLILQGRTFYFVDDKTGVKSEIGTDTGSFPISESRAREAFEEMRQNVLNEFRSKLDKILLPQQNWIYFDSTIYPIPYEPEKKIRFVISGPFGKGMSYDQSDFDDLELFKQHGLPSKIHVQADERVDGLQFTYGGFEGPLHGGLSGKAFDINLGGDTKIKKVGIKAGDAIDGIQFITTRDEVFNYGRKYYEFTEIYPPVEGAYLASIKGKQGSDSIESLALIWVYYA